MYESTPKAVLNKGVPQQPKGKDGAQHQKRLEFESPEDPSASAVSPLSRAYAPLTARSLPGFQGDFLVITAITDAWDAMIFTKPHAMQCMCVLTTPPARMCFATMCLQPNNVQVHALSD